MSTHLVRSNPALCCFWCLSMHIEAPQSNFVIFDATVGQTVEFHRFARSIFSQAQFVFHVTHFRPCGALQCDTRMPEPNDSWNVSLKCMKGVSVRRSNTFLELEIIKIEFLISTCSYMLLLKFGSYDVMLGVKEPILISLASRDLKLLRHCQ